MKNINYFIQFSLIIFLYSLYKILGLKNSQKISAFIFSLFGPIFRSKKICKSNLSKAFPLITKTEKEKIIKNMWINYGKIFSEYPFIKNFRISESNEILSIENYNYLKEIKMGKNPVIFISGHFNNFELMAMYIDKFGVDVAAIYRPLNNFFLNKTMEQIRVNNICKNQIKKGKAGSRELIEMIKKGYSIALMIDQRVSEGIYAKLFNKDCLTTTIPAQLIKKYDCEVVPVYVERVNNINFKIYFNRPIIFDKKQSNLEITTELNHLLEKMILKNPNQWIWSHNRWK